MNDTEFNIVSRSYETVKEIDKMYECVGNDEAPDMTFIATNTSLSKPNHDFPKFRLSPTLRQIIWKLLAQYRQEEQDFLDKVKITLPNPAQMELDLFPSKNGRPVIDFTK